MNWPWQRWHIPVLVNRSEAAPYSLKPRRAPKWWRWLRARLGGYFWLPCPSCGEMFAGYEKRGGRLLVASGVHMTCPACPGDRVVAGTAHLEDEIQADDQVPAGHKGSRAELVVVMVRIYREGVGATAYSELAVTSGDQHQPVVYETAAYEGARMAAARAALEIQRKMPKAMVLGVSQDRPWNP